VSAPLLTVAAGRPDFHGRPFWEAVAARGVEVEIVALVERDSRSVWQQTAERVRDLHVPLRHAHANMLERWLERPGAAEDLALALLFRHTPEYGEALGRSAERATAVVAAGSLAAPALLLHTRVPLVIDARDVAPLAAEDSAPLVRAAATVERRACQAGTIVRCRSRRHASALRSRYELPDRALLTLADSARGPAFTDFEVRRRRASEMGIAAAPLVLALPLGRDHTAATAEVLDDLDVRLPEIRLVRRASRSVLPALLTVAVCALVLDDGPGAREDVVTYAQAGVPLLAEAGALADTGLQAREHAVVVDRHQGLASAVRDAVTAEHAGRVTAARDVTAGRTHAAAAEAFLLDDRVASLLEWGAPMLRRRRRRCLTPAA
jgi:hypothetical protein